MVKRKRTPELKFLEVGINLHGDVPLVLDNLMNLIIEKYKNMFEPSMIFITTLTEIETEEVQEFREGLMENAMLLEMEVHDHSYIDDNRLSPPDYYIFITDDHPQTNQVGWGDVCKVTKFLVVGDDVYTEKKEKE